MSDVARAVDGLLLGPDGVVSSVATDSRLVRPGGLFVALPGEHTDGGRFVDEAFLNGAAGVLVRDNLTVNGSAVCVRSTNDALMRLAADERRRAAATVVAITGANGKTSTKDMTSAVVARRWRTHASPGSFNNEVGLPMTLLGAANETEVVVAEMGARRPGDVSLLCSIAKPDIVVVTNVGVAHLEIFGSWERIVEASAEPIDALGPDGVAVLNADDPVVAGLWERCKGRVVTFGVSASAEVRAEGVVLDPEGRASFLASHGADAIDVSLGVPGEHMVSNALAAIATGTVLEVPISDAAAALADAEVSHWRMETFTTSSGVRVVNDAYNANPESVAAALKAARWMAGSGQLIAVLGTMAELGPISLQEHERVGELAARLRVDRLITVGPSARSIATAGVREGVEPDHVAAYDAPDDALADVRRWAQAGRPRPVQGLPGRGSREARRGATVISILVAGAVGLAVTLLGTPVAIRAFTLWGWGQRIREDGPHTHLEKMGTPTMGGVVMILALLLSYIAARLTAGGTTAAGLTLILAAVGFGMVGFFDDFLKVRRRRSLGLTKSQKFLATALVSVLFAVVVAHYSGHTGTSTNLSFIRDTGLKLGAFFLVWCFLVLTASSNAVNLTDGLDGLAAGSSILVLAAYTFISFWQFRHPCTGTPVVERERLLRRQCPRHAGRRDRSGGDDGGGDGVPMVERGAGQDLHGRHRSAGARRVVRRARHHDRTRSCCW